MEEDLPYPIFFECESLSEVQKKKIKNYFQIQRRSGGGECGAVTHVSDKVYRIDFKDRHAQRRVLQKSEHSLEFAGGPVVTVCDSLTSRARSMSPAPNFSLSQQGATSTPSLQTTTVEDYELQLDPYRLCYLDECPEKQTVTRRLGKAKVRLLWKDIEHNLKRDFPEVKVTKNDLGQIVLEGSVEEIFKAGELISEEKFVLERTVPGVSPHLLAYLRKAYGEPGVLGDYLVFGSGSSFCLLGQTEEVEDLSELVKQFILDNSSIEGKLILPFPELVQQLPELLRLHNFDCSGVTFHPLTSSSGSTVVLKGPAAKMTEVRNRLGPFLDSLVLEKVTIDMPGAGRYFTSSSGRDNISSVAQSQKCVVQLGASSQAAASGLTTGVPRDGVHVEIIRGDLKNQQVDCLVCPMSGQDPISIRVGKELSNIAGPQLAAKFYLEAGGATIPGDTVLVEGLSALPTKRVVFLNVIPWDNDKKGNAVQVLRQGIKKILACCRIRAFGSVALPVLGTGAILRFPHSLAARVLLEEVQEFEKNQASGTSFLVRIVIHNSDKESNKFTAMLGGVQLQMVRGNIIHETTDVIVNTTDFSSNQSGVSEAILTAAGPTVQSELARVGKPADRYCITGAGLLGCVEIIHASFLCDIQTIQKKCKKILKHCETKGYSSAAFPAINTGAAGMVSSLACKAMLDGMTSAITDLKPTSLSLIRIVILEQSIFQAFRTELENRFGQTASRPLNWADKIKQMLEKFQMKNLKTAKTSPTRGQTVSFHPPPAVFSVIGCGGPDTIRSIKRDLEGFLQKQLLERVVEVHDFFRLEPMELEAVKVKIRKLEISLDHRRPEGSGGLDENRAGDGAIAEAQDRAGSGKDVYVLRGLKEDVLSVTELFHRAIQKALREELQEEKELKLALQIQWSLKESNGSWTGLDLHQNYLLEEAHSNQQVSVEIKSQDGRMLTVNLRAREATDWLTGFTYKVKRTETEAALELPSHWEPMEGETFHKFELQTDSEEYKTVAQGFLRTAKFNICKIERVQNVYLWHAYTISRQRITAKNGPAEVGEMSLYHGTSAEACEYIEKDKFDRGFAGQHATSYGKGVYFAVNADYSATRYAPPDAQGLKRVYVARVLTGRYTLGNSSMKAAPPRGSDRGDCFDSVVNNLQWPIMFVIFHDDQAYPEYLITFKS